MSTEHQQYSTENQADAIREYAARRGIEIVRTYADRGKERAAASTGRDALKQLLDDVQTGRPISRRILVYDVSRWGRFQDADESAYYEYICKRAGITVQYCAEQFENDGSPVSTIVKGVKRAMAGEYSRELSAKVFTGQCRLIELGFRQGGPAGYGLRRMLVDQSRCAQRRARRAASTRASKPTASILVPGPDEEIETVRWMYRAFVEQDQDGAGDRGAPEARGLRTDLGRPWTRGTVHQVLINEKYIGNNVWNRASFKLQRQTGAQWARHVDPLAKGVFEPVVERSAVRRRPGDHPSALPAPLGWRHAGGPAPLACVAADIFLAS